MKQSELPALIITMAAEALIMAEETNQSIDDELIRRIMNRHGPFERGSFGYHVRTVRTVCKKPTQLIKARRDALKAEKTKLPVPRAWRDPKAFDAHRAQLPPGDRE